MNSDSHNLILTGFMGTGKTTLGQMVAREMGFRFVDMDDLLVERIGKSIPDIFRDYGEGFFRGVEAGLCAELGAAQNLVIATGGGALISEDNLNAISGSANVVICLTAAPDALIARLESDPTARPMIDRDRESRRERIVSLLEQRRPGYDRIRLHLDTTHLSLKDAVQAILGLYEQESARQKSRIPVISPTNRYDICVENGLLHSLPDLLDAYKLRGRLIVATNTTVAPLYGEKLAAVLPNAALVTIPDGEIHKNLDTVNALYRDFAAAGLDRSGIVIALGGGVVGDTVGYAAAAYMRGVPLVQIPTTLLSMVDSSVGGKVGVDIPEGKNLVGAFKQPELVVIDPDVLRTLPEIEIQCGMTEAIKHGLLGDPGLLEMTDAIRAGDADALKRAIQVKVDVVQRDPYERGERAHLNLGHTFAHAIERVSGYTWRHGEAVNVGILAAARLSHELGTLDENQLEQVNAAMRQTGLGTTIGELAPDALWDAMRTDKKWRGGRSHFIILDDIGKPKIARDVLRETVIGVLEGLK